MGCLGLLHPEGAWRRPTAMGSLSTRYRGPSAGLMAASSGPFVLGFYGPICLFSDRSRRSKPDTAAVP